MGILNFATGIAINLLGKNSFLRGGFVCPKKKPFFITDTKFKANNFNTSWKFMAIDYLSGNTFFYKKNNPLEFISDLAKQSVS